MNSIFVRILVAVVGCLLAYAIIPPFCRVVGFDISGDVMTIVKICIAGIAIFYVLRGSDWQFWRRTP